MAPTPDSYAPFTTTMPTRLLAAARRRAEGMRLPLAGYLAALVRADLTAAGEEVPAPPPPKQNGRKPRQFVGKDGAEKKSEPGA